MASKTRREQRGKGRDYTRAMKALELRQGSRTERHKSRVRYDRADARNAMQHGVWE